MSNERPLTATEIIQRLNRLVLKFYKESGASFPQHCADSFPAIFNEYFIDALTWLNDLPELDRRRRGKGYTQYQPSKKRVQVIKELEQFASFLQDNLERRPNEPLRRTQLKRRVNLSVYACEEIVRRTLGTSAIMVPFRGNRKRPGSLKLADTRMWGRRSSKNDVHLLKRGYAAAAGDRSIKAHGFIQAHGILLRETAERLEASSAGFHRHVPIFELVAAMNPATMTNLSESALFAARDLKVTYGLWDRTKDPQKNRTVTDFERPVPIYRFFIRLLNQGWEFLDVPPDERKRLMAGNTEANSFEKEFAKLVAEIIKYAPSLAHQCYRANHFDPLVGVDARSVLKNENPPSLKNKGAWLRLGPTAARLISARIVKHREQIVILRDHAETLRQWNDFLASRARADAKLIIDRDFFNRYGPVEFNKWVRECERQYDHGVFDPRDVRSGRDYVNVERLGVDTLRRVYKTAHRASPRFADVTGTQMRKVLDVLHSDKKIQRRIARIIAPFK